MAHTAVKIRTPRTSSKSWDAVARWYSGWAGPNGSRYHRRLASPALLELLAPGRGERVLDLGSGHGVLAPHLAQRGVLVTGVDLSPRLISIARRLHGHFARFIVADVTRLESLNVLSAAAFDAATFLLSIQDIDPLEGALKSAAWALRTGGRLVIVMTHPCFRVPRQSGWGWDEKRALRFRRVDRYLSRLAVPMQPYDGRRRGATRSYHRPLEAYVEGLAANGLVIDAIRELPAAELEAGPHARGFRTAACREIPLFMGLRAVKR